MAAAPLNVFKGRDSVRDYFDPDQSPPLPLVEIPDRLNPYRRDGVRIYAKMLTALPAQNVKSLPALNMLMGKPGAEKQRIVEASSGSTVLSLGIVSRVLWGNEDVTAAVTNKKTKESLKLLRFFGLNIFLYGGLAQQEPTDPRGIMSRLRRRAEEDETVCYPGQYDNADNWKSHERWTGAQILRQLPEIDIFCTTVGTGGCITGTGSYFKANKPSVTVLGIFNVFGDPTPGPRHLHGFKSCGFPWKDSVDTYREVASADAYRASMLLSREGLIAGPSSGQALRGLLDHVGALKEGGRLDELRGGKEAGVGEVNCVFTCSDLPYQYLDGYFAKLGEDEFPRIENEILLSCDQDRHDERWILEPAEAARLVSGEKAAAQSSSQEDLQSSGSSSRRTGRIVCGRKHGGHAPPQTRRTGISARLRRFFCRGQQQQQQQQQQSTSSPRQCEAATPGRTAASAGPVIIDLRNARDFDEAHLAGSVSLPVPGLAPDTAGGDLFGDAEAVHRAWSGLRDLFGGADAATVLDEAAAGSRDVLVVCYDGDVSRLATSGLRSRGVAACSVLGGWGKIMALKEEEEEEEEGSGEREGVVEKK